MFLCPNIIGPLVYICATPVILGKNTFSFFEFFTFPQTALMEKIINFKFFFCQTLVRHKCEFVRLFLKFIQQPLYPEKLFIHFSQFPSSLPIRVKSFLHFNMLLLISVSKIRCRPYYTNVCFALADIL